MEHGVGGCDSKNSSFVLLAFGVLAAGLEFKVIRHGAEVTVPCHTCTFSAG
jgi:hypothetical protein